MTAPTAESFEDLLSTFPPERIVTDNDPAYAAAEAVDGCATCASGQPCQTLLREDVNELLQRAALPESEQLAILRWMIAGDYSSLTHSMDEMLHDLRAALVFVVELNGKDLQELPYDPACSQQTLLQAMIDEASRHDMALSDVNLRLVIKTENNAQPDLAMANAA